MPQSKTVAIYYDQQCAFCKRSVELLVKYGRVRTNQVAAAQDYPEMLALLRADNSWVVENDQGVQFTTFAAGVEIARHSPLLKWLVPLAKPRFMQKFGEWTYRKIANNRSRIPLP